MGARARSRHSRLYDQMDEGNVRGREEDSVNVGTVFAQAVIINHFSVQMHYDLKDFCDKLDNLDVKFMLSNSDTSKTREIYGAFQMNEILVNRSVGSTSKTRKKAAELIITNY